MNPISYKPPMAQAHEAIGELQVQMQQLIEILAEIRSVQRRIKETAEKMQKEAHEKETFRDH